MLTRFSNRRSWTLLRQLPVWRNFATVAADQQPSPNHTHLSSFILSPSDPRNRPQTLSAAADVASLTSLILNSSNRQSLAQSLHSPAIQWCPQLVNAIIKRLWNHGPKALEFFQLLTHHPSYVHHASSYDHAIDISARLRDWRTLWTLVSRMRTAKVGPSPKTFAIIAERTGKALEVMKEMVDRGLTPNLTTYNTLVRGYFRAAQIEEGCKFFSEMKKRKWEVDVVTYTTVIHGLGVAGEIKRSRNVFNGMVKEGVLPSVATYNAFIQVLCKKDSVANALLVFEEMVSKGYVPNTTTYAVVIRGLCHAGEFEKAMQFLGKMKDDGCQPNLQTYNVMIRYLSDAGEIDKAICLFETMGSGDCLPNLDTYNILIKAMFVRKKSDDVVLAGNLLIEMVDRGFVPRRFTFNRILNGLSLTGNHEFARKILRLQSKCGAVPLKVKL
ncbi:Pentatricopeptide repeat-containing protein At1g74900, mitochondrial [Linum perenne]